MRAPFGSQAPEPIPAEVFPRDLSLSALTKTVAAKLHVTTSNLSERDGAEVVWYAAAARAWAGLVVQQSKPAVSGNVS